MARRIAALFGFVILIALAVTLLWRVYEHHHADDPYEREEPVSVRLDAPRPSFVKFADRLS